MILLHIIAGLLGLMAGAVALSTRKGATLHRQSGMNNFLEATLESNGLDELWTTGGIAAQRGGKTDA